MKNDLAWNFRIFLVFFFALAINGCEFNIFKKNLYFLLQKYFYSFFIYYIYIEIRYFHLSGFCSKNWIVFFPWWVLSFSIFSCRQDTRKAAITLIRIVLLFLRLFFYIFCCVLRNQMKPGYSLIFKIKELLHILNFIISIYIYLQTYIYGREINTVI